ncbi:hypothetical protein PoB_003192600 [Plakobranchus ocellatus]|uniref:Endonuclease/exonuclease/phosphatase domain-containing protein n=1 Tax=Plakobranchus ocellatus TaxID=259542 RepID=A0AAV4AAS2_9GAST|nr:hypothetical protein PoB_003192600 [Plakobranchus ocellatus]
MDTLVHWNVRSLRNNFAVLKLLLNRSQSAVVALQEFRLVEGQLPPLSYALLLSQDGSSVARQPSSYKTERVSQLMLQLP